MGNRLCTRALYNGDSELQPYKVSDSTLKPYDVGDSELEPYAVGNYFNARALKIGERVQT